VLAWTRTSRVQPAASTICISAPADNSVEAHIYTLLRLKRCWLAPWLCAQRGDLTAAHQVASAATRMMLAAQWLQWLQLTTTAADMPKLE
jgi:hypothetical protein